MMQRTIAVLPIAAIVLTGIAAAVPGCASNGAATQCFVGADCASGACSAAGQCVPGPANDGGALDGATGPADGSAATPDGANAALDSAAPLDDASVCVPTNDGTITRAEVPMAAGLRATYVVADNATWDTTGTIGDAGTRTWDLTATLSGDHSVIFEAEPPAGAWWAPQFTSATFAMPLIASNTDLGIFRVGDEALSLIGIVSATNASPETEVTYATPIPTLQFPLSLDATWTTTSSVTGTYQGIPDTTYSETYVTTVDAAGQMSTPLGSYSVLRVGTVLTQTVGVVQTVTRSFVWVAECVGPVAAVTSASNATTTEFSNDAEVRRLSP